MQIRSSKQSDIPNIMAIYEYARNFMKEHGNPNQWGPNNWPPEALICEDIKDGKSYVCVENEEIIGTFFFDCGDKIEPTYNIIDGAWNGCDSYGVVHRIASSGSKKGVGTFCINWAYQRCGHLRIDTHEDNKVMQNLLEKLGFSRCGIIYVREDKDPRIAYEKN